LRCTQQVYALFSFNDNELSLFELHCGTSTKADKSAPTDIQIILLNAITILLQ
jgi:hypothetical protein